MRAGTLTLSRTIVSGNWRAQDARSVSGRALSSTPMISTCLATMATRASWASRQAPPTSCPTKVLRGQQLLHVRPRRHASRRAGAFRHAAAQTVDQIPVDACSAPPTSYVRGADGKIADYQVGTSDITARGSGAGPDSAGAIVLIRTGYSRRWPDAVRYLGTAERAPPAPRSCTFPACTRTRRRGLSRNRHQGRRPGHSQHRLRPVK